MLNHRPLPPLERLLELFEVVEIPEDRYGKWSGLVRKISHGGRSAGAVAGTPQKHSKQRGRIDWVVQIDSVSYLVSRIIYYMMIGEDPHEAQVDHEDRNPLNNNWWNLRLDTDNNIQGVNKDIYRNNSSGVVGVTLYKPRMKWMAQVMYRREQNYLGLFTCKIEAAHAVNKKWRELGWLELGRKLNDLNAIQCDCDKCKSQVDEIAE